MPKVILVIDDEAEISRGLELLLKTEWYQSLLRILAIRLLRLGERPRLCCCLECEFVSDPPTGNRIARTPAAGFRIADCAIQSTAYGSIEMRALPFKSGGDGLHQHEARGQR